MSRVGERDYYTVAQAADLLDVSPSTIWRWIEAERLPAYRLGPKTVRIKREDLAALLEPVRRSERRPEARLSGDAAWTIRDVSELQPPSAAEVAAREEALSQIDALHQRLRARRGDVVLPSNAALVAELREERGRDLERR